MGITPESTVVFQLAPADRKTTTDWASWASAWPDALAFALGLGIARGAGWTAGDLIWSLWLSSLVIGYATIVWMIGNPAVVLTVLCWRSNNSPRVALGITAVVLAGAAFMLAFFSIHFLGFHFVHSGFLLDFFPIDAPGVAYPKMGGRAVYMEVFRRYWAFLPAAFLSHRAAFMRMPPTFDGQRWFEAVIGKGKSRQAFFFEPYRNVMRMHGLIFFFVFAHFAGLENFAVYAVIYAVYFFPWRLVRRDGAGADLASS